MTDAETGFKTANEELKENITPNAPALSPVIPHRLFMNQINTYNAKYISSYIAQQYYGLQPEVNQVQNIQEENVLNVNEDTADEKEIIEDQSKFPDIDERSKYEIVGTVKGFHKIMDHILFTINEENKEKFESEILKCGFIVYDISQHEDELPKALDILNLITKHLDEIKDKSPATYTNNTDERIFILISTVMTWATTKLLEFDDGRFYYSEIDYKKRRPHPNYQKHLAVENEVLIKSKKHPKKLKTYVVCSGIIYGEEESDLEFWFKLAWNNEKYLPVLHPGKNFVPLIHISDLAKVLHGLMDTLPTDPSYILAVEQLPSTLRQIMTSLSRHMGRGITKDVAKADAFLYRGVNQKIFDRCTINILTEPIFIVEQLKIVWQSEYNIARNMPKMVAQFKLARNLNPLKIVLHGPPLSGKTMLTKKICEKYRIKYVSVKSMIEDTIQELNEKIAAENERQEEKEESLREWKFYMNQELEEEGGDGDQEDPDILEWAQQINNIVMPQSENGRLPEEYICKLLRQFLQNNVCLNRGYILDGFPKTIQQAKLIYENDAEEEFCLEGVARNYLPNFVISFQATDEFLCERVMQLPEKVVQGTHYNEENMIRRLSEFRTNNTDDNTVLNFFEEKQINPEIIDISEDDTEGMESTFQHISNLLGEPIGFNLTLEEDEELNFLEKEARLLQEEVDHTQEKMRAEQVEKEYQEKMEQISVELEKLQMEDEEVISQRSEPFRGYLTKYILPVLTNGLSKIIQDKPDDPFDSLAEFLFRENPKGKMFNPAYSRDGEKLLL